MTSVQHNSRVFGVSRSRSHTFSKDSHPSITLVAGLGVEGGELLDELRTKGFEVDPGTLGENSTTIGFDVLSLPRDTQLHIGPSAVVQVTGLRNPCKQLDAFQQGLTQAVLERTLSGELIRKCGIMGIVLSGGEVKPGDQITVVLPDGLHCKLERV